jgi:hypothetical protein
MNLSTHETADSRVMSCLFNFDTTKIHHGPQKSLEDIPEGRAFR